MTADDGPKPGLAGSAPVSAEGASEPALTAEQRPSSDPHADAERRETVGSDVEELFYEGSDLHGEGRYEEAMERFDRCLAIDPNYADALLGKAMAHLERGEHEDAIELGNRIAALNPDDVLAYTSLSMFYERAGRIKEAEEAGAKARMLDWKRRLATESEE